MEIEPTTQSNSGSAWALINTFVPNLDDGNHYVFDVKRNSVNDLIAVSSSNHLIKLYKFSELQHICTFAGHKGRIWDIQFGPVSSLLYSIGDDRTVRKWDFRTKQQVASFTCAGKGITQSVAVNADESTLAYGAGSDIFLWDLRANKAYNPKSPISAHQDDVTQVKFHPKAPQHLVSASEDQTICAFELTAEVFNEDALTYTFSIEQPVNKFGFFGDDFNSVYSLSSTETFSLWSLQSGEKIRDYGEIRGDTYGEHIDYVIDCIYHPTSHQLLILAGSNEGNCKMLSVSNSGEIQGGPSFLAGHTGVVRSVDYDFETNTIITGGEEGRICFWSPKKAANETENEDKGVTSPAKISSNQRKQQKFKPY